MTILEPSAARSTMQTLRERAISTIVKYNMGPRNIMPLPLQTAVRPEESERAVDDISLR